MVRVDWEVGSVPDLAVPEANDGKYEKNMPINLLVVLTKGTMSRSMVLNSIKFQSKVGDGFKPKPILHTNDGIEVHVVRGYPGHPIGNTQCLKDVVRISKPRLTSISSLRDRIQLYDLHKHGATGVQEGFQT